MQKPSKKTVIGSIVLLAVGIGIGASGGNSDTVKDAAEATVTETSTAAVTETVTSEPAKETEPKEGSEATPVAKADELPEGCLSVGEKFIERLELKPMMKHGGELKVTKAVAAKGVDNYFVAASTIIEGVGGEDPMIFGSLEIENGGAQIFSVNNLAKNITRWPDSGVNAQVPGAKKALECLEKIMDK